MTTDVDRLVEDNARLAYHIANRERILDSQEALSVCLGALWEAAKRWDGRIPFGQYAGVTIKYALFAARRKMRRKKRGGGCLVLSLDDAGWDLVDPALSVRDVVDLNEEIRRKNIAAGLRKSYPVNTDLISRWLVR